MGNVTASIVKRGGNEVRREVIVDITGSSSYATSGDAITAAVLNTIMNGEGHLISTIHFASCERNATGYEVCIDRTNSKVIFFDADSEAPNTTNLSAVTVRVKLEYAQATGA